MTYLWPAPECLVTKRCFRSQGGYPLLHVVRPDGTIEEVEGAVSAVVEGDSLICRDALGHVVKIFDHLEVIMFGKLQSVRKGIVTESSLR